MALMSELRQWCSIRTAVKDLFFVENLLYRSQKAYDAANNLLQQRERELESIDNRLQRYKRKQESKSAKKREKYEKLVDEFEAGHVAANVEVNRASQEAQRNSRKLERASRRMGRRQALIEARIRGFRPTSHVMVMDVADITSINMMRDQRKELHFTLGRSVKDCDRVSINNAARTIGLCDLTSHTLVFLDGANFRILSVEDSEALGYRRLV